MDIQDILGISGISDIVNRVMGGLAFVIIILIILLAAYYVVTAFKWQFIGRKSGLAKDWMPFVPFARTIYKLSIVDEAWWKMFFLDGWWLYAYLLDTIISGISNGRWGTFSTILVSIYIVCCIAYNIYWRFKFYTAHNIKPHLAITILVPFLGIIRLVWDYMIAFGRNYPFTGEGTSRAMMDVVDVQRVRDDRGNPVALTRGLNPSEKGAPWQANKDASPAQPGGSSITGLSGMYAGQTLPLAANEEMVIGRDNALCNLIVDQNAEKVSRKHCSITYDAARGNYMVTDYSTNGTFIDGGSRLVANMPTALQRGAVIALGSKENRFRLG
jgi:hypothetical protein